MPSPTQLYRKSLGSDITENYERFFVPTIGKPVAQDLLRTAELRPGQNVLDVACGTGIIARLALPQVGVSGSVTGLDLNPGMLAVARSLNSRIEWHEGRAEDMSFSDESFDVVICQLGLQFMEDKAGALKEMGRVLVPGGRLYLNVPGPIAPVFNIFAKAINQYIGPEEAGFARQVFSLHESDEVHQLLDEAGFREKEVQAEYKELSLPVPRKFLWQYVYSTPLAGAFNELEHRTKVAFEQEVIRQWQQFVNGNNFTYRQRIVTASAGK